MEKEDKNQNHKPPYLSVSRLKEVFKLLSTRSLPSITAVEFKTRQFGESDSILAVSALKFLGIINQDGTKTNELQKLQIKGVGKAPALLEIIKKAYSKLFEIVPEANKLSRDDLYNEFIAVYGLSPRQARTAVPVFIWLCSEAGQKVDKEIETRDFSSNDHQIKKTKRESRPTQTKTMSQQSEKTTAGPETNGQNQDYLSIPVGIFSLHYPKNDKVIKALALGKFNDVYTKLEELSNLLDKNVIEDVAKNKEVNQGEAA